MPRRSSQDCREVHGRAGTKEYRAWQHAKQRCYSPSDQNFHQYGGRGIKMDVRWQVSFSTFFADMGPCPSGHTLERIDNDGDYAPGNCCWASRLDQARNRRSQVMLMVGGEEISQSELARRLGKTDGTIFYHVQKGLSGDQIVARFVHAQT